MERVGKFEIDNRLLRENKKAALAILTGCVVVRAEAMFHKDAVEYIAYGEHFEPNDPRCVVPRYDVTVRDLVGGKYAVTFTKSEVQ